MTTHSQKETPPDDTETLVVQKRTYGRRSSDRAWSFERTVPFTFIVAALAQLAVGIWFASAEVAKMDDHERRLVKLELSVDEMSRRITDKLSVLEAQGARTEAKVDVIIKQK